MQYVAIAPAQRYSNTYNAFSTTDEIQKEELNTIIELVKSKDTEFYNQYRAVWVIKDLGGGHTTKHDSVVDAAVEESIVREEPTPAAA